jgi:trk system potassium uptake protein TrkH
MTTKDAEPARPAFAVTFPPTVHGLPARWVRFAGVVAISSLLLQHGFQWGKEFGFWFQGANVLLALFLAGDLVAALFRRGKWREVAVSRRFEFLFLGLFLLFLLAGLFLPPEFTRRTAEFLHLRSAADLIWNGLDFFLLALVGIQLLRGTQRLLGRSVRPEVILAGSFAAIIVVGTVLLLLPNSSANPEKPIRFTEALFTSTSAACVTGLVVRDTGSDFSVFGQVVILALFQVGGLGIITFVALLSIFSARTLPLSQMMAFRQLVNAPALTDLKRQIVGIVLAAGVVELIGAALIYQFMPDEGDPLGRIRWSIFHAVSAFCNAGFALQANSLEPYAANAGLMFTFMALIIVGGLGFLVIPDLLSYRFTRASVFRRFGFFRRIHAGKPPERLSVQTRIALTVTAALLFGGLIFFLALEFNYMLRDRTMGESFLVAAFQSVTVRTAGFNTIPIHELRDATLVFMIMLMVIGANPVSTGGGIKTVSFGILLLALRAMIARRERVEAFGRTIPGKTLFAALSVFIIYVISASIGIFLLALFDPEMKLQDQAFEVVSALSTVGLSTGITADLSTPSQLVLCVLMFVGRIGPISLVLSVFQSRRASSYQFPEEEVIVG